MTTQLELYGGRPPHVQQPTSEDAANRMVPHITTLREKVYHYIASCGALGATDDQIEVALKLRHQTASARRRELVLLNRVVDSGRKHATRSGSKAIVWVAVAAVKP